MRRLAPILLLVAAPMLNGCDMLSSGKSDSDKVKQTATVNSDTSVPANTKAPAIQDAALRPDGITIENPDAETIALVYFSLTEPAPINEWVASDAANSSADEFTKKEMEKERASQLKAAVTSAAEVGKFVFSVRSEISEYDEKYGEYYIGMFGGGSNLNFNYRNKSYKIEYVNKEIAQIWKVNADEAKRIFEKNNRSRSVVITLDTEIIGYNPTANGGTIKVKILKYSVDSQYNESKLGTVNL